MDWEITVVLDLSVKNLMMKVMKVIARYGYSYIKCTNKDTLLSVGHCMTYHEGQGTFAIECPYFQLKGHNVAEHGYIKLPSNVSELNDYMCGSMNRKGWLCKDCIDGFGPSVTSVGYKCANCTGV